jgi:hypothetical protein
VQSVHITTNAVTVSSNPVHGEVYSIQHYVIKFVSVLRLVDGFPGTPVFSTKVKVALITINQTKPTVTITVKSIMVDRNRTYLNM